MRKGALCAALAVLCLLGFTASASARHPFEWAPDIFCGPEQDGSTISVPGKDDPGHVENWRCEYDPEARDWRWVPQPPTTTPDDGVGYKREMWTASDSVVHVLVTRIEWINHVLYSGTDLFLRKPLGTPHLMPANHIGIKTRVTSWDGAQWVMCRESQWEMPSSTTNASAVVKTWTWGTAPCGARWYISHSWGEHYNGTAWEAKLTSTYSQGGTSLGGANASNGMVWDAPPDYKGPRPKPPKRGPNAQELAPPRAAPPQAAAASAGRETPARLSSAFIQT
jgi:hypothetical protein